MGGPSDLSDDETLCVAWLLALNLERAASRGGMRIKELGSLLKQTFQSWNEDKAARLAAALSFYAVLRHGAGFDHRVGRRGTGSGACRSSDAAAATAHCEKH